MIVCLIAEGSYPYVTGGVSSWMHDLIKGTPDVYFKVLSIMPSHKEKLKYKYLYPDNLMEIKTIYLDDYLKLKRGRIRKKIYISSKDKDNLLKFLFMDNEVDWKGIINLINSEKFGNSIDFLQSELFYNIILKYYQENYSEENFNTFFWTIRTMILPFIKMLQTEPIKADIYHPVSTGYAGILGVSFHERMNKPLLLTEHGIYAREREEEILKAPWVTGIYKKLWIDFFYFLSQAAYSEADQIIALFKRNQHIQIELGAPKDKTNIIANGIDVKKYDLIKKKHEGFIVGSVLRVVPIKDVMTIIRAFKIVKNYFDNVKLYLIGPTEEDPDYYDQCVSLVELLNLKEDIIFTGNVEVHSYYKIIDVMVLSSISEGQPLVMLESMAASIPIVATDVGACKELLVENESDGACGLLTNLVDADYTASQIIYLLENEEVREKFGKNGKERVKNNYTKREFLRKYNKTYYELR